MSVIHTVWMREFQDFRVNFVNFKNFEQIFEILAFYKGAWKNSADIF
jgi:hypothetical protein